MTMRIPLALLLTAATLLCDPASLCAKDIPYRKLGSVVQKTIGENLAGGHVDEIKVIRIDDRTLYVVEIDLPGRRERKIHIAGDGKLLKIVDELRPHDLPQGVRATIDATLSRGGRLESVDRITIDGKVEYHLELDLPKGVELNLIVDESGLVLSRTEESKF